MVFLNCKSDHDTLLLKSSSGFSYAQNTVQMSHHVLQDTPLKTPSFWSRLSYVDICTWCSITWNVLDPIPAWVTPRPPLRLSEGITPSKKTSPRPLSWLWWTCVHFHSHHSAVLLASWGALGRHTFLLLNCQFRCLENDLIKAKDSMHLSLLSSAHLHKNGFQFL